MKRRTFNELAALSALACILILVLWMRSYQALNFFRDQVSCDVGEHSLIAYSDKGELCLVLLYNPSAIHVTELSIDAKQVDPAIASSDLFGITNSNIGFLLGAKWPCVGHSGCHLSHPDHSRLGRRRRISNIAALGNSSRAEPEKKGPIIHLSILRLRPPRNPRPVPGVRHSAHQGRFFRLERVAPGGTFFLFP